MDRSFLLDDTTLGILCRRLGVLGDDVHPFNKDFRLVRINFQDFPGLFGVLIVSGDHDHVITFLDIELGFESVAHFFMFFPRVRAEKFVLN